jgi:hypothetical protein
MIEQLCCGFEHVEVNSALISLVRFTFPEEEIIFFGEKNHIDWIKNSSKVLFSDINFIELELPRRFYPDIIRIFSDVLIVNKIFRFAKNHDTKFIIFCSLTSSLLYSIKFWQSRLNGIKCILIPHSILETINFKPPLNPLFFPFWFPYPLNIANAQNIKYLVYGNSIKTNLIKKFPRIQDYILSIDLPYLFDDDQNIRKLQEDCITFGFFGVGTSAKGIDEFFSLPNHISTKYNHKPKYVVIGQILDKKLRKQIPEKIIIPSVNKPLSRDEYEYYAQSINYSVMIHKPYLYNFTASGSFFDALKYQIPIIAIRNPFFEFYFNKLGNIGYMCSTMDEVYAKINEILRDPPVEEYQIQINNLIRGRKYFDPRTPGSQFSEIMNTWLISK